MSTIDGLPAHILLVHAVVVLVPLSALLLVLVAVWPPARRRWAVVTAALAVLTAITVPLATESGEWLEHRVEQTALLRAHTELGDTMVPWAIGLAVLAVAIAARELLGTRRRGARGSGATAAGGGPGTARAERVPARAGAADPGGRVASLVLALLAAVVAVGTVGTAYRIGDSGARAAWTGQFTEQAQLPPGGERAPDG